jgi:hypothetical protein
MRALLSLPTVIRIITGYFPSFHLALRVIEHGRKQYKLYIP